MIDSRYRVETLSQQMEYILSNNTDKTRLKSIKFKASSQFLNILRTYIHYIENGMCTDFKDIIINGNLIISADEIFSTFKNDYNHFSYAKRLEKLRQRLFYLLEQYEEKRISELLAIHMQENDLQEDTVTKEEKTLAQKKARQEIEPLKTDVIQMTSFDINVLYCDLYRNIEYFAKSDYNRSIEKKNDDKQEIGDLGGIVTVSYTHLRAHETVLDLVCRLLLEKKTTQDK